MRSKHGPLAKHSTAMYLVLKVASADVPHCQNPPLSEKGACVITIAMTQYQRNATFNTPHCVLSYTAVAACIGNHFHQICLHEHLHIDTQYKLWHSHGDRGEM